MKTNLILTILLSFLLFSCSDGPETEEVEVQDAVSKIEAPIEAIEEEPEEPKEILKETPPGVQEEPVNLSASCQEDLKVLNELFKTTSFSFRGSSNSPNCEWDTNFGSENLWKFNSTGVLKHSGKFNESFLSCLSLKNLLPISNFAFQIQELPHGNTCRLLLNVNFQELQTDEGVEEQEATWNTQSFELKNISNNGFDAILLVEKKARNDDEYDYEEEPEEVVLNFESRD